MKKYICIIALFVMAFATGCQEKFETSIELGVNNTRVNIPWSKVESGSYSFVFPVYSNGDWTIRQVEGGEWLTIGQSKGHGTEYVSMEAAMNILANPRVIKVEVKGGKKTIPVYFVIASETVKPEDIEDALLDAYLY